MKKIALSFFVLASSGAYVWDQAGSGPISDVIDTTGPVNATEQGLSQAAEPAPASIIAVAPPATPSPAIERQGVQLEPPVTPPGTVDKETTAAILQRASKPSAVAKPAATKILPAAVGQQAFPQGSVPALEPTPPQLTGNVAPQSASFAVTPAVYIPLPQPRPDYPQTSAQLVKAGMKASPNSGIKAAGHGFADGTYVGPITDAYYGLMQIQASIQGGRLTSLKVLKYPNDRRTSISINRQALPMLRDEAISAQGANVDIISGATLTSKAFRQSLAGALKQASS
ncbi:MAG: FMN-binding protein [Mesorhizobium sp.]|uniref:FMN-binding protein n=1 Tax=Mesorhizobium sp. TaxID=1871066 RepID=UPI001AC5ECA5|nr:FMN-binding protein [Mesorhizobium sp.]MBN9216710.1 FMN-binding protein [Mesorhizobium sp.]